MFKKISFNMISQTSSSTLIYPLHGFGKYMVILSLFFYSYIYICIKGPTLLTNTKQSLQVDFGKIQKLRTGNPFLRLTALPHCSNILSTGITQGECTVLILVFIVKTLQLSAECRPWEYFHHKYSSGSWKQLTITFSREIRHGQYYFWYSLMIFFLRS